MIFTFHAWTFLREQLPPAMASALGTVMTLLNEYYHTREGNASTIAMPARRTSQACRRWR
jgi:hypothetical protein